MQHKTLGILWISFFTALVIHISAFFWLQNIEVYFYQSGKALLAHRLSGADAEQSERKTVEESKRRNDQLAAIFKDISGYHTDESLHSSDFNPQEEKIPPVVIEGGKGDISFDPELLYQHELDQSDLADVPEAHPAETRSLGPLTDMFTSFRQQKNVEYLAPHDDDVDDELIKAALMVQGIVLNPSAVTLDPKDSISVGTSTKSNFIGNSLQNRSGLIHDGRTDSLFGGGDRITTGEDPGVLKFTGFHQQPGIGYKDPVLPLVNKDHLRGFASPTIENAAGSNDFELKVEYALSGDGTGYLFKLTLQPKESVRFRKIAQNYFFLIDRSHSIRYLRYLLTKRAVVNALQRLTPEDTFNILLFDDKVEKFAPQNVKWTPETAENAKQWLLQRRHGGVYGSTDLYASLGDIVPEAVADNEVNTAILFSDGDTYLGVENQRKAIAAWELKNRGKVSLFAIASGRGNNLDLLSVLSLGNKGLLYYAPADADLEDTLVHVLTDVGHPIGKEITVAMVSEGSDAPVMVYPADGYLPDLYESVPYVIYGKIDKLNDFHVFYQGKYYDKALDIRQIVSFERARSIPLETIENELKMNIKSL